MRFGASYQDKFLPTHALSLHNNSRIEKQDSWLRGECSQQASRPAADTAEARFWSATCLAVRQFDGLKHGYWAANGGPGPGKYGPMSDWDFLFLESNGEPRDCGGRVAMRAQPAMHTVHEARSSCTRPAAAHIARVCHPRKHARVYLPFSSTQLTCTMSLTGWTPASALPGPRAPAPTHMRTRQGKRAWEGDAGVTLCVRPSLDQRLQPSDYSTRYALQARSCIFLCVTGVLRT